MPIKHHLVHLSRLAEAKKMHNSLLPGPPVRMPRTNQPPEHMKNTGEEPDGRRVMAQFIQSKKPLSRLFFFCLSITSLLIALITKDGAFRAKARRIEKWLLVLPRSAEDGGCHRGGENKSVFSTFWDEQAVGLPSIWVQCKLLLWTVFFFFFFQPAKTNGRCLFKLSLASNTSHPQIPFDILQGSMALNGGKPLHTKQTHLDHPVQKLSIFKPLVLNGTNLATTTKKSD